MGLKKNISLPTGIDLPEAYFRIVGLNLDFHSKEANVIVAVYKDKATRDSGSFAILKRQHNITYDINNQAAGTKFDKFFSDESVFHNGSSILKVAYWFLKTLEDYQDSVDE